MCAHPLSVTIAIIVWIDKKIDILDNGISISAVRVYLLPGRSQIKKSTPLPPHSKSTVTFKRRGLFASYFMAAICHSRTLSLARRR
jgi:hypothetical protein